MKMKTVRTMRSAIAMIMGAALINCGGGDSDEATAGNVAALNLKVVRSSNFDPRIEHSRVDRYRIRITGPGISAPIVAEFEGSETNGIVDGVPVGRDRVVEVEGENPNGAQILAGENPSIEILEGENGCEVLLESVPIITNIADNASVDSSRISFRILGDPSHGAIIEDEYDGAVAPVINASTSIPEISLDESTGLGIMMPLGIQPGTHTFIARDQVTGRNSKIAVMVIDGSRMKGAPLFGAATPVQSIGWIAH